MLHTGFTLPVGDNTNWGVAYFLIDLHHVIAMTLESLHRKPHQLFHCLLMVLIYVLL